MDTLRKLALAGAAIMPLGFAGCAHHHHDAVVVSGEVIVTEEPPVERVEVIGVAPARDYVWAKGCWVRAGSRWDWREGHWERRPHAAAEWEHSHWERRGGGWVLVEGRWR
ncbi:MAG: hypothetical protein ACHRHE_04915 [Tepidisphaerales bacterium]